MSSSKPPNLGEIESIGLKILADLGNFTATSYWEEAPTGYLAARARKAGLNVAIDPYGNLLVLKSGTDRSAPGICFVAHTDHPGYEVVEQDGRKLTLKTLGGVGLFAGRAGSSVIVIDDAGNRNLAVITGSKDASDEFGKSREADGWLGTDTVYADLSDDVELGRLPRPVVPNLVDFEIDNDIIRMRAADDLAGCAAVITALESIASLATVGNVYGLFTRAEEVGLIGARMAAKSMLLPMDTIIVSVETSSILPGAEIGKGVVIRTGDRTATFDHEAEAYLIEAAQHIKSNSPEFKIQRQLMSAGGCEASAFKAFGYSVTGTAFPLGSWHNRGDSGVEPEFISKEDFVGGTVLIAETAKLSGTRPQGILKRLSTMHPEEGDRLKVGRDTGV